MEEIKDALEIAKESYTAYGIEVGKNRVYPNIYDGMKPSYKRAIYGIWKDAPRSSISKVPKLAACALPFHPHGDSIEGVVIYMGNAGNKLSLMNTQGQWGNSKLGVGAAAPRYIGGMLSEMTIKLFCDSVNYSKFVKGEIDEDEPFALPAMLPLCFINGLNGIPSGLPTVNIPPLNISWMLDYYIEILKHKDLNHKPKWYPIPNFECDVISSKDDWKYLMDTGKGSIYQAPIMKWDKNDIVIEALPESKSIDHIYKILSSEIASEKVDIIDETTDRVRIRISKVPKKWQNMQEIYDKLDRKLQTSVPYNFAFYDEEKIYVPCGFRFVVQKNLQYLIDTHSNRLERQLDDNLMKLKVLEIIEDLKITNKIHDLIMLTQEEAISYIVDKYSVEQEIANKVLQKPISYLTRAHESEIEELKKFIEELKNDQSDIYDYLYRKYKSLKREMTKLTADKYLPTTFR